MDTSHVAVEVRSPVPSAGESSATSPNTSPPPSAPPLRGETDRVELSTQGKAWAPHRPQEAADEPGSQGPWERDRLSRLDQMELLVQKGRYNVTPYMVDEIALRLARSMILA